MPWLAGKEEEQARRALGRARLLTVAILAALGAAGALEVRSLLGALREVDATEATVAHMDRAYRLVVDLETGLRGFLATGDREFLEPYARASPELGPELDRVASGVRDQPGELALIGEVRARIAEWRASAEEEIAARAPGGAPGVAHLRKRKASMDALRADMERFLEDEDAVLRARKDTVRSAGMFAGATIALLLLAAHVSLNLVTHRLLRTLEDAYERTSAFVDAVLRCMPAGLVVRDADSGKVLMHNAKAEEILGHPVGGDGDRGDPWRAASIHADGTPLAPGESPIARALATGEPVEQQVLYRQASGALRSLLVEAAPLRGPAGKLRAGVATFHDVTPLKEAEERLAITLRSIGEGVIATDTLGQVTLMNPVAEALTGVPLAEARGKPLAGVYAPTDPATGESLEDPVARAMRGGAASARAVTALLRSRGSAVLVVQETVTPIRDGAGAVLGVVLVFRDTTAEHRSEQAVRDALAARERFLAVAAHEFRNPLTGLNLALSSVASLAPQAEEKRRERIERAKRQVARLASIVDRLVDVRSLQVGRPELEVEKVDLGEVVRQVVAREVAARTRAAETLSVVAPSPVEGSWNPSRLDQIVSNLVSNALKFGDGKPVVVSVEARDGRALLRVADHGPGIPAEERKRIFERFERAVGLENVGGLGLGLWIVRELVATLGGTIEVASEVGRGSTFTVSLPI